MREILSDEELSQCIHDDWGRVAASHRALAAERDAARAEALACMKALIEARHADGFRIGQLEGQLDLANAEIARLRNNPDTACDGRR